ncbi:conserved membrane protein of unknown function [Candidatus Hydrogenisulfobacillus filiaventi]|uniref:Type II secretion system protein GspF domain-containing protein n=1 Tax=Candidatus Hydrogenisulfobacillus filiaventi TaxID=2707344 RepID=A0A6F8ZIN6_9FIRM|nr:conserved membrane protein of unknown function [Candidatus Hydrogenisulfobacillus filiaventi]
MIGILIAAVGGGLGVWWALAPAPPRVRRLLPAPARRFTPGPVWPRRWMRLGSLGAALGLGAGVLLATRNPLVAAGYGVVGAWLPRWLEDRARAARRQQLDRDAYALAMALRNLLPLQPNVPAAIRALAPHTRPPLADILQTALGDEARQAGRLPDTIRQAGTDWGLPDLGLFADVLYQADRLSLDVAALLTRLTTLWGERLQQEQQRAGQLAASAQTAWGAIAVAAAVQVLWPALSPTARHLDALPIGWILGGASVGLTLLAAVLLRGLQRKAGMAA